MSAATELSHRCIHCQGEVTDDGMVGRPPGKDPVYIHRRCRDMRQAAHQRRIEQERERAHARIDAALAGLPRVPWGDPSDAEFTRRAHKSLARYAVHHDPRTHGSALLLGPSGAGKTLATVALIHRLAAGAKQDEPTVRPDWVDSIDWTTGCGLIRARREHPLDQGEARDIHLARWASLLVIDELGPEPQESLLMDVIDDRYAARRPTICTSGLTRADFVARYGDALLRRLTDRGVGVLVDVHPQRGAA